MHIDSLRSKLSLGLALAALGACGDDGNTDPFGSGSQGSATTLTTSAGSDTDSGASASDSAGTSSDGSASAGSTGGSSDSATSGASTSGGASAGTTSDGSTSDASTSGGTGFKFDLGGEMDLPGNGSGGGNGEGCKFLDLLFIVDISGSMSEEKANLAANFPGFVQVLDDYVNDPNSGALGYRLGVTNSSWQSDGSTTGLDGALTNKGGMWGMDDCGTNGAYWLDGPAPNVADNFTCLAQNPKACTNTCSDNGQERPLDTIQGFIDKHGAGQTNEGFYQGADSLLVIVTLTDEDDHSEPTLPATIKASLDGFTQGPDRYVIVTITGPENTGCNSAFGSADATPRLSEFTDLVNNGTKGDICLGDLSQPLKEALDLITFSCDTLPPPQ